MTKSPKTAEIALVLYQDSLLSAIYGLTDLFQIANLMASRHTELQRPNLRVTHWKHDGNKIACVYDTHPGTPNDPVAVILPPSMIEPVPQQATKVISHWVNEKHQNGATICSVCGGSFLLAETGLLDGRTGTTHWMFTEKMAVRFPNVNVDSDKMVIDDGDIITAGGMMAWIDLGLRLVQRMMGPTLAMETSRFMLVDSSAREQRYYSPFVPQLHHGDEQILKVQHWLQANGAKNVSLKEMAEKAGMEERTFLRRFQKGTGLKPTEYCQQLRVGKAREMLEFTHQNVEQIAWIVGYEDPSAFRKSFSQDCRFNACRISPQIYDNSMKKPRISGAFFISSDTPALHTRRRHRSGRAWTPPSWPYGSK